MNTYYRHILRPMRFDGSFYSDSRAFSVAYQEPTHDIHYPTVIYVQLGLAIVHPDDRFNRVEGRLLATSRMSTRDGQLVNVATSEKCYILTVRFPSLKLYGDFTYVHGQFRPSLTNFTYYG